MILMKCFGTGYRFPPQTVPIFSLYYSAWTRVEVDHPVIPWCGTATAHCFLGVLGSIAEDKCCIRQGVTITWTLTCFPSIFQTSYFSQLPSYKGFKGTVEEMAENHFMVSGEVAIIDSTTIEISELPVKTWTQVSLFLLFP